MKSSTEISRLRPPHNNITDDNKVLLQDLISVILLSEGGDASRRYVTRFISQCTVLRLFASVF